MDDRASDPAESGRTVAHVHEGVWIQDSTLLGEHEFDCEVANIPLAKSQVHLTSIDVNRTASPGDTGLGSDGIFLNPESSSHRSLPACSDIQNSIVRHHLPLGTAAICQCARTYRSQFG